MAKPTAGSSVQRANIPLDSPYHSSHPLPHRRRRRLHRTPVSRLVAPSPGLLTILASIAASSLTVGCSPTPPHFLCPFISTNEGVSVQVQEPRDLDDNLVHLSPTPTKRRRSRRNVPYRYQEDEDGRWRRMESYTLYGSTVCLTCDTPSITASSSISDSGDTGSSPPQSPPKIDLDTLPVGWHPSPYRGARTTLILTLSLVLAFIICFFIIGCLFWRKSQKKRHRENDVEMKALRRRRADARSGESDRPSDGQTVESRANQKLWSRATARWRANARYTARQRRGRRSAATRSTSTHPSTASLQEQLDEPPGSVASSPTPSRPLSRRSSITSTHPSSHTSALSGPEIRVEEIDSTSTSIIPAVALSPPSPIHASPPAYHPQLDGSPPNSNNDGHNSSYVIQHKASSQSIVRSPDSSAVDNESCLSPASEAELTYTPSMHAAHVATDDKSLLARLGELASSPPVDPSSPAIVGPSALLISAPEWQDEDLDGFSQSAEGHSIPSESLGSDYLSPASARTTDGGSMPFSPTFPFPPPPSKGKMADLSYFDYSYSYESLEEIEEPSAPPFEESVAQPSAPPLGDFPSHPPLNSLSGASAPPLSLQDDGPDGADSSSLDMLLEYVDVVPANHSNVGEESEAPKPVDSANEAIAAFSSTSPGVVSETRSVTDIDTPRSPSPASLASPSHNNTTSTQTLAPGNDAIPPSYLP